MRRRITAKEVEVVRQFADMEMFDKLCGFCARQRISPTEMHMIIDDDQHPRSMAKMINVKRKKWRIEHGT